MDAIENRARELLASHLRGKGWTGEFAAEVLQDRPADVRISGADAIEALVAALTPPEGYVLVPAVPTKPMVDAAVPAASQDQTGRRQRAVWDAMLAACPEVR